MIPPEPTMASRRIYQGRVVGLRVDTVRLPDGGASQREIVEHKGSVAIVPLDDQGHVLLVRQYRKAVEQALLEVPAGGLEEGEVPEACARRELAEETGHTASRMEHLASFYMTPGFCTEEMHAFLATGLAPGQPRPEQDENIELVPVPLATVGGMIHRGEIRDAKSIVALLMALERVKGT